MTCEFLTDAGYLRGCIDVVVHGYENLQIQCRMGYDSRRYARHDYRSHSSTYLVPDRPSKDRRKKFLTFLWRIVRSGVAESLVPRVYVLWVSCESWGYGRRFRMCKFFVDAVNHDESCIMSMVVREQLSFFGFNAGADTIEAHCRRTPSSLLVSIV